MKTDFAFPPCLLEWEELVEERDALRAARNDLWRALHRLHGTITDAIVYDEDSELGQDIFAAARVLDRTIPGPG